MVVISPKVAASPDLIRLGLNDRSRGGCSTGVASGDEANSGEADDDEGPGRGFGNGGGFTRVCAAALQRNAVKRGVGGGGTAAIADEAVNAENEGQLRGIARRVCVDRIFQA